MPWIKPDFEQIALCMEVTAYVNTEDELPVPVDGHEHHLTSKAVANEQSAE